MVVGGRLALVVLEKMGVMATPVLEEEEEEVLEDRLQQ
jgi:hypothetical protein